MSEEELNAILIMSQAAWYYPGNIPDGAESRSAATDIRNLVAEVRRLQGERETV